MGGGSLPCVSSDGIKDLVALSNLLQEWPVS